MQQEPVRKLNVKGAESANETETETAKPPNDGFAALTKRLLTVSRDELRKLEDEWRKRS